MKTLKVVFILAIVAGLAAGIITVGQSREAKASDAGDHPRYADSVVSESTTGSGPPGPHNSPDNVLGSPDGTGSVGWYNLGTGTEEAGEIIVEFLDNILIDGPGDDLTVWEAYSFGVTGVDEATVEVSLDNVTYYMVGTATDNPDANSGTFANNFDISGTPLSQVRFVRIQNAGVPTDDIGANGFDLDSVEALHNTFFLEENGDVSVGPLDCTGSGVAVFDSIQAAETAASPFDTIQVCDGTYDENVEVEVDVDDLTIEFEGTGANPVVDGQGGADGVFIVTSTDVTIDGFVVGSTGAQWGIIFESTADDGVITNNEVNGNADGGIRVDSLRNNIDTNGVAGNLGPGIFLTASADDNDVQHNTVESNGNANGEAGIRIDGDDNRIFDNGVSGNSSTCGILLGFAGGGADGNEVWENVVTGNGNTGIRVQGGSSGNDIHNNDVNGNTDGIRLQHTGTTGNDIHQNTIGTTTPNTSHGIDLKVDADDNTVGPLNTINTNDGDGVKVASDDNVIIGNEIVDNGGIGVNLTGDANGNTVVGNTINDNTGDGVYLGNGPTQNLIYGNTIEDNDGDGVSVSADDNQIVGNVIRNNDTGVDIYGNDNLNHQQFCQEE